MRASFLHPLVEASHRGEGVELRDDGVVLAWRLRPRPAENLSSFDQPLRPPFRENVFSLHITNADGLLSLNIPPSRWHQKDDHMGIGSVTSEFMNQGKELLRRLRTTEANMLTDAEIRMLRLQLHLLDIEASNRKYTIPSFIKLPAIAQALSELDQKPLLTIVRRVPKT
jgi:hypothetical protein